MRPSPKSLMDHREFPVLYVDDEPDNLRIFELTFRREFSILTANGADEALHVLNDNPVAVVLSDQRMPGMSGVDLLARVRALDSKTIRILVTAYGDAETLGVAINDGSIYRYVPKPWQPDDLRMTIRRAIESYALDRERDALIRELTQLNQLSKELHSELDISRLCETLVRTMHRDLGFDGAALLFFDEEEERLQWQTMAPNGDAVSKRVRDLDISRSTASDFIDGLRSGEPQTIRIQDFDDLSRVLRTWITEVSADEILVVPLLGKGRLMGALAMDNRSGGRGFGADDQTLLDGIATQAVIAIDNARIVEDLRAARNQVQRADRLGTLGTLAAGLAHEINNPLVSIQTFLTLAPEKRSSGDPDFWETYHSLACDELERIRGLVSTMSRLAHGGIETGYPSDVPIEALAEGVATLLQGELGDSGVRLRIDCESQSISAWGVKEQLQQVLLNLVHNAIHASPAGGEVHLRIAADTHAGSEVVRLSIEDSGPGIPEENLERVFDPFFTTKDPDKGTGLGLMITHRIVNDHGGEIEVQSRRGEGATFSVLLPKKPAANHGAA